VYPIGGGPVVLTDTRVPSSVTMIQGSINQGSVANLAVPDGSRLIVSSAKVGSTYRTDWYGEATLQHPPLSLTVRYDGSFNTTRTQTLYLYNWSTSAWTQIDQASIGTATTTRTWSTSAPGAYVNAAGQIRLRVQGNTRTTTYTSRGDYMAFTYEYQQGTLVTVTPEEFVAMRAAEDRETVMKRIPQANIQRLEAAPTAHGVRLAWTVGRNDHVDGFSVYRELADGTREFVGREALVEVTSDDALFSFVDASPSAAVAYWLGARSCAGPEQLVGPIHVSAAGRAPAGPALTFSAAPNPVRGARVAFSATLPEAGEVRLDVFDLSGRRIASPFAGHAGAGTLLVEWSPAADDGARVPAGVYFARFETLGQSRLVRLTVLER
jgi:hypothetical protein